MTSAWDTGDIFADGTVLEEQYTPDTMPERESEADSIRRGLRKALRGESPKNMFLDGLPGQGKTEVIEDVLEELQGRARDHDIDVATVYHSCSNQTSSYAVACTLVEEHTGENPNGHNQQKVFDKMYDVFESLGETVVVVFDEIDTIGRKDDLIYDIPRAPDNGDLEETKIGIIGVTNDSSFLTNIDPRAQSSLYDRTIQFDAYNANELENILTRRAEKAFVDGAVDQSAISLCSAFAARDKGSARQAIEYLYEAGEVAIDEGDDVITNEHVRRAKELVQVRNITDSISGLTFHDQAAIAAILSIATSGDEPASTRRVYAEYTEIVTELLSMETLSFDKEREHLHGLDTVGIVDGSLRSTNERGGPKYFWELATDVETTLDILGSIEPFQEAVDEISRPDHTADITDY